MGLLDAIFSAGDSAKRRIRGLLADPVGSMQQSLDQAFPTRYEAQNAISQLRGQPYNPDALQAYNTKLDSAAMNFAPMGMTVWHGSPHKFSKFDMSKIGTGEGAQAYGHGLYMAEAPDVAKSYQSMVGARKAEWDSLKQARDEVQSALDKHYRKDGDYSSREATRLLRQQDKLNAQIKELERGQLYKVDIPDEAVARFLDWDKPLSQQAPEVQKALSNTKNKQLRAMVDYANVPYSEMAGGEAKTMGEAFRLLNLNLQGKSSADSAKASALLAKQGIPGIRYLDGGSRSSGQGSSNFVLFDDQLPRILETNGVPTGLQPWKPNEWQGLLGGGQ